MLLKIHVEGRGSRGTGVFQFRIGIHITEIVNRIMSTKFMVVITLYFEAE